MSFLDNFYKDEWVFVGSNEYITEYFKPSSVVKDIKNKIILVMVKDLYSDKGRIELINGVDCIDKQCYVSIGYTLGLHMFDYINKKHSMIYLTDYSISGQVLDSCELTYKSKDIIPDSINDLLLKTILHNYDIES